MTANAWIDEGARYASDAPVNAMTVDVEDYFQVSAFERHIAAADWERMPVRVERNTDRVLELFAERGVYATFFTLGWVAERFPALVRRIAESGHEVASHGFDHTRVVNQEPAQFRADITRTKGLLEDVTGRSVQGYRAASYSIGATNLWALDVIQESGYRYSSSIYPIRHDLYGMPDAPRFAFRVRAGGLLELPITSVSALGRRWPCGGGGFFRLFPYALSSWGLRRVNRNDRQPGIFYFHPWEVDPDQPRIEGIGLKTRMRHYLNLSRMETRLRRLLGDFRWDRMDRVFAVGG
jgi:polysaccharide deacetylase family protein (PEP-CTERM system associated)